MSYYNNMALIGQTNRAPYYTLDKFAGTGDFSWYFRVFTTQLVVNQGVWLADIETSLYAGDREYITFNWNGNAEELWFFSQHSQYSDQVRIWCNVFPRLNDWQEILLVRKNGVFRSYEDGVLKHEETCTREMFCNNTPRMIMGNCNYGSDDRYFKGYIDEIKYWHNTAVR